MVKKLSSYIWLGVLVIAVVAVANIPITKSQKLNSQCQSYGKSFLQEHADLFDSVNNKRQTFYSSRLDTCVMSEINELENEWGLYDIQRNYIKRDLEEVGLMGAIFYCDRDGVDNVILQKADELNGEVFQVPYEEYLDNAEGGEPRTLKTPETPYTRDRCGELFWKKQSELR